MAQKYTDEQAARLRRFGDLVRARREALGLDKTELSETVKLTKNYLTVIENGHTKGIHTRPSYDTIKKLDGLLDLGPDVYEMFGYRWKPRERPISRHPVEKRRAEGLPVDPEQDERRRAQHSSQAYEASLHTTQKGVKGQREPLAL